MKETNATPKIQKSSSYDSFHANETSQRKYRGSEVIKLAASMRADGFWKTNPVSVYKKGNKMYLNTGHHRVAAAKLAEVPVLYVVESKWSIERIVNEGGVSNQKAWSPIDCARAFAEDGNHHYQILLEYEHKGIPLGLAASMLIGNHAAIGKATALVKSGKFVVEDTEHINLVLYIVKEVSGAAKAAKTQAFMSAISACLHVPEFDPDQLIARITSNPGKLEKRGTRDQMLVQIEGIYNFRSLKKVSLSFLARQATKRRSVIKKLD